MSFTHIAIGVLVLILSIFCLKFAISNLMTAARGTDVLSFPLAKIFEQQKLSLKTGVHYSIIFDGPRFERLPLGMKPHISSDQLAEAALSRNFFPITSSRHGTSTIRLYEFQALHDGVHVLTWKPALEWWERVIERALQRSFINATPISENITVHFAKVQAPWKTYLMIPGILLGIWGIVLSVFIMSGFIDVIFEKMF